MRYKLQLIFSGLLLLAASCNKKDDDQPIDKLPPATMTGANTFGCLVNGEPWLPHSEAIWDPALNMIHAQWPTGEWQLKVGATKEYSGGDKDVYQIFILNVWNPVLGENSLSYSNRIYQDLKGCGEYHLDTTTAHSMFITRLDLANYIASGTFSFTAINANCPDTIRVTEGRFDGDSHP